jgi:hypothetical protein
MLRTYTELRLQLDKPEVIVRPEVWHVGLLQETSVAPMVAKGVEAMEGCLGKARDQFTPGRRAGRSLRSLFAPGRRKEADGPAA